MCGKGRSVLQLKELLKDWPCTISGGDFTTPIFGITENASNVKDGFIFVARKGKREDGTFHVEEAVRRGASALVVDRSDSLVYPVDIPLVVVADCKKFISHASAQLAGHPSSRMTIIAITGTNGKTTVSHFIGQLLKAFHIRAAVIGTTGVYIDGIEVKYEMPSMTTPLAEYLHPLLRRCEEDGVSHIVLEASSIGLEMNRLDHCEIDLGVLLNIGTDHYEEHGSKQQYINAKKKLITLSNKMVVNKDDSECFHMVANSHTPVCYFGSNCCKELCSLDEDITLALPGNHNKMNALAAISVMKELGFPIDKMRQHIHLLKLPEGRLQRLDKEGVVVFVDYAHTPDALRAVLETLTARCYGNLITVFGCGGDRDKGKRKEMGELAVQFSSSVILTTDNPRTELPSQIINDIMEGFGGDCSTVESIMDRKTAIRKAVFSAAPGDIVLVAGKGHEKTQHTADGIFPFSDLHEVRQALEEKLVKAIIENEQLN